LPFAEPFFYVESRGMSWRDLTHKKVR
jgi:hypothetical protein